MDMFPLWDSLYICVFHENALCLCFHHAIVSKIFHPRSVYVRHHGLVCCELLFMSLKCASVVVVVWFPVVGLGFLVCQPWTATEIKSVPCMQKNLTITTPTCETTIPMFFWRHIATRCSKNCNGQSLIFAPFGKLKRRILAFKRRIFPTKLQFLAICFLRLFANQSQIESFKVSSGKAMRQCSHSIFWNGWRCFIETLWLNETRTTPFFFNSSLLGLLTNLWIYLALMFCTILMSCVAFDNAESIVQEFGNKQKAYTDARPLVNWACRATCSSKFQLYIQFDYNLDILYVSDGIFCQTGVYLNFWQSIKRQDPDEMAKMKLFQFDRRNYVPLGFLVMYILGTGNTKSRWSRREKNSPCQNWLCVKVRWLSAQVSVCKSFSMWRHLCIIFFVSKNVVRKTFCA